MKHTGRTSTTLAILQDLSPDLLATCRMLTHHSEENSSFVMQIWGPQATGKQKLVDIFTSLLSQTESSVKSRKNTKPRKKLFMNFDNGVIPKNISSRKYSKLFFMALIKAMRGHECEFQLSEVKRQQAVEDHSESDGSLSSSCDEMEDSLWSSDNNDSAAKKHRRKDPSLQQNPLQSVGETAFNQRMLAFIENIQNAPTRSIVIEIVALLRHLGSRNYQIIISLRRFDTCLRAAQRVLYGLLNLIADSSSSIILITTAHSSSIQLEKRISSRYSPFLLYCPVLLNDANIHSKLCAAVSAEIANNEKNGDITTQLLEDELKFRNLYDSGWGFQVLQWVLDAIRCQPTKGRSSHNIKLPPTLLEETLCRFDPGRRFHSNVCLPKLGQTIVQTPATGPNVTMQYIGFTYSWLEKIQILVRECVILIVAVSITMEQTSRQCYSASGTSTVGSGERKNDSMLLGRYSWLKNAPPSYSAACFSADFLVQSVFPREGGVFQSPHLAKVDGKSGVATTVTNWLFTGCCFDQLLCAFGEKRGENHKAEKTLPDDAWHDSIVWLMTEHGLLLQPTPTMIALAFPPHHCTHITQQKLKVIQRSVRTEQESIKTSQHKVKESSSQHRALQTALQIASAVENEINSICKTFDVFMDNLMKTRNVV